jgi:hypothetical protein
MYTSARSALVDGRDTTGQWNSAESGLLTCGETAAQIGMTISPYTSCWLLSCIWAFLMGLRKCINHEV